jgi:hypothetical protein
VAIVIPTDEELKLAEDWWHYLPSEIKGNQSIWVILAMYAEHVLHTRTVHFRRDDKVAEIGRQGTGVSRRRG